MVGEGAGQAVLLELATEMIRLPQMPHEMAGYVALSHDGARLATSGWHSGRVKLWDRPGGRLLKELATGLMSRVYFTPDSREMIVARQMDFTFHDLKTMEVSRRLPRDLGLYPGFVAFTADGKLMALEMAPGLIHLKEITSGRTIAKLEDPYGDHSTWMSFTPDGTQLVVAARYAGAIHRWDLRAIRERLKTMNLDWEWPEFSPPPGGISFSKSHQPLRVQVAGGRPAATLNKLTSALRDQGKLVELEALLRDELVHARLPDTFAQSQINPVLGWTLHHLADVLRERKTLKDARAFAEEACNLYERHPDWAEDERQHASRVLAAVLMDLGDFAALEPLHRKTVQELRARIPADDPQLAAALAGLTSILLAQQKFTEAEPPVRECLAIREKKLPDDWLTFNSRSMLGGSLLGQKKFPEAEPLLLSGYEGMKQRADKIPDAGILRLKENLQRLAQLYEATGRSEKAAEWNQKLAELDQAEAEKKAAALRP